MKLLKLALAGNGGNIIFNGEIDKIKEDENSLIGPFLNKKERIIIRDKISKNK